MIPSLLITTSASDLEKSIEEGGALSGRLSIQQQEALEKSFKRETVPKAGAKVRKPEKDPVQKEQERQQRKEAGLSKSDLIEKALMFIIDPSQDKKDPLLANTHGEEFHSDADKETVDFLTRTGQVNPNDPVHNPPVTPELNGFPLALPMFYCSLPASDLLKSAGAGSRGGRVIGHTKSGLPIYESRDGKHFDHWNADDHHDAAKKFKKYAKENSASGIEAYQKQAAPYTEMANFHKDEAARKTRKSLMQKAFNW